MGLMPYRLVIGTELFSNENAFAREDDFGSNEGHLLDSGNRQDVTSCTAASLDIVCSLPHDPHHIQLKNGSHSEHGYKLLNAYICDSELFLKRSAQSSICHLGLISGALGMHFSGPKRDWGAKGTPRDARRRINSPL